MPRTPPFPPFPPFPGTATLRGGQDEPAVPPAPAREQAVLTVTALNQAVARTLERSFPLCWVGGEISNFTRAASGHWYFTLKDEGAQVRAVMFRGRAQFAAFTPREGDRVEVRALVTLYAPRGDYQLSVEAIRRAGVGNLFEAFVRLKDRLTAEGLFDAAAKRPLPVFPRAVGVVTSTQAAALRDVLTALARRAPHVRVIVYPAPVQGAGSAERIAAAIAAASRRAECDVLLVCRGGGSIEDLWSFNEEAVARAIRACAMPVISGVGHETDFTIADFAADLRAPTPTAAAELAAGPRDEWFAALRSDAQALRRAVGRALRTAQQTLDGHARALVNPRARIARERAQLQALAARLGHAQRNPLARARLSLNHLRARVAAPPTAPLRAGLAHLQARLAPPDTLALRATLGHLQARLAVPDTRALRATVAHLRARLPAPDTGMLRRQLMHLQARLAAPDVPALRVDVDALRRRAEQALAGAQRERRQALGALQAQLEMLNPQRTLERGYAIVTDAGGAIVRTPAQLQEGERVRIRVAGGTAGATLADVRADERADQR